MIHKKCGGKILLDCTSMYSIQSPSIRITPNGILPGVIQIDLNKEGKGSRYVCSTCGEILFGKEQYEKEIVEICCLCGEQHCPSEIRINDYISGICINCISKATSNDKELNPSKNKDKLYIMYGELLKKQDSPTLLTVLLKK